MVDRGLDLLSLSRMRMPQVMTSRPVVSAASPAPVVRVCLASSFLKTIPTVVPPGVVAASSRPWRVHALTRVQSRAAAARRQGVDQPQSVTACSFAPVDRPLHAGQPAPPLPALPPLSVALSSSCSEGPGQLETNRRLVRSQTRQGRKAPAAAGSGGQGAGSLPVDVGASSISQGEEEEGEEE